MIGRYLPLIKCLKLVNNDYTDGLNVFLYTRVNKSNATNLTEELRGIGKKRVKCAS